MSLKLMGRNDGITLVELAVVLSVVAVMAAVAIPTFFKMIPHMELRDAASDISTLLMESRMRSIAEAKYFRFTTDMASETRQLEEGTVVFDPGSGTNIIQWSAEGPAEKLSRRVDIYADTGDPLVPSLSGETVIFRPDGTTDGAGFEAVYLRNSPNTGERYRVKILGATGKIGIERWTGGTWDKAF